MKHNKFAHLMATAICLLAVLTSYIQFSIAAPPCGTKNGGPCPDATLTATITGPASVTLDQEFTLSASESTGVIVSYSWSHNSGADKVFTTSELAESLSVSINTVGSYTFTLVVSDGNEPENSDSTSHTVVAEIDDPGPQALKPSCGTDLQSTIEARVEDCISLMALDDKIGQMTMGDHLELKSDDHVTTFKLGALLAGGGHAPTSGNMPEDWRKMVDKYQLDALSTNLGIPLLFGIDAIHGHNNVFGATIFPHNIGLGATRNPILGCKIGQVTAKEVAATGINWTFSPTLCVSRDERWGRTYECFGEVPEIPAMMTSIIGGYQGTGECTDGFGLSASDSILATAKHWVGDGGTLNGIDQGDTPLSEIEEIHVPPYFLAINDQSVGSAMISYSSIDGIKMHANPANYIDSRLKGDLGFGGIVLSDWTGIKQVDRDFGAAIEGAINGGIDMAMEPYNYDTFVSNLTALVGSKTVSETRINDAVRRILTKKIELGLFEPPYGRVYSDAEQTQSNLSNELINSIGSFDHRVVARQAVSESLVLLKNQGILLPYDASATGSLPIKILVTGKSADNIGNQSGGWTIDWQGDSGDITLGDTIYDGIAERFANNANVDVQLNTRSYSGFDLGIVVVGETPYAEGKGDDSSLTLSRQDKSIIRNVCNNMACAVILISGRPLIITDLAGDQSVEAIVAAWLPGSEGGGVADVLFGTTPFTGILPISWPRDMNQIPINDGDGKTPLYPVGFGLVSSY